METLHRETVDLGNGVRADLFSYCVQLAFGRSAMTVTPLTRQDANRASIALKKAARRLQAIADQLPNEPIPAQTIPKCDVAGCPNWAMVGGRGFCHEHFTPTRA